MITFDGGQHIHKNYAIDWEYHNNNLSLTVDDLNRCIHDNKDSVINGIRCGYCSNHVSIARFIVVKCLILIHILCCFEEWGGRNYIKLIYNEFIFMMNKWKHGL